MPNIVEITVRSINGTKPMFDQVRRDSTQLGRDAGNNIAEESSRRLRENATANAGGFARAGDVIGDSIGRRISERITQRIRDARNRFFDSSGANGGRGGEGGRGGRGGEGGPGGRGSDVDIDIDRPSLLSRFFGLGKEAGMRLTGGIRESLTGALTGIMSGDFISMILKGLTVGAIAYTLAPVLGAGINAAFLLAGGASVIGLGIAAAFQDPKIKAAASEFGTFVKGEFAKFGKHFQEPVLGFFGRLKNDLAPQLSPIADKLGKIFAPVTDNLGKGLIGFLQNLIPPLSRFIESSAPLWDELSESLPKLGEDIGYFFDKLKDGAPYARVFLNDFLNLVGWIIRRLGELITFLSLMYVGVRTAFVFMSRAALQAFDLILSGAAKAFGWVPGIGPKLQRASSEFSKFRQRANAELNKIQDEDVNVKIRVGILGATVGLAASVAAQIARGVGRMGGKASGGIIGAASGGIRNGLTWVGENGPELVDAAPGSRVYSNPDSMRMAQSGGGSNAPIIVQFMLDGKVVQEATIEPTRRFVQQRFGGNVQLAFGAGS